MGWFNMVEVVVTHKQGVKLVRPRISTHRSPALAREEAEQKDWDGFMRYNGRELKLRVQR